MIRTLSCKECGEVNLYIDPKFEQGILKCATCDNVIKILTLDERYIRFKTKY